MKIGLEMNAGIRSALRRSFGTILFALLAIASNSLAQFLPEVPSGPIEKTRYWAILEQRWRIIEPLLFKAEGSKYLGTEVRFDSSTVSVGKVVIVRTTTGTTARVTNIPKADMDQVREFHRMPSTMTVLGTIVAIDAATRTISIKAGEIRPGK